MKYTEKNSGKEINIKILYKFSVHNDFGRDMIVFKEGDTIKLAYIYPIEESIEVVDDVEKIKEACIRSIQSLNSRYSLKSDQKNPLINTSIEQEMIISSRKITKYRSKIAENANNISSLSNTEKIEQIIKKHFDGEIPNSIKQKIENVIQKTIADKEEENNKNKKLLAYEQERSGKKLNKMREFFDNQNKDGNIERRIASLLELTQYCQNKLNSTLNMDNDQRNILEKYEKLKRKKLAYDSEYEKYFYISFETELKEFENKKYIGLKSKIDEINRKINEISNQYPTIISNSIFSNEDVCKLLLFEKKFRESSDYVKRQIEHQNKIQQKIKELGIIPEYNQDDHLKKIMMNKIIDEEKKKDSALYRTTNKIKSSKITKSVVNKLKNCKLVKNNLVIGIQNLTLDDVKKTVGKPFNFIKNTKLCTNKLSTKIGGFIGRRAFKIKKFRNNINSMTNDLENANKRR